MYRKTMISITDLAKRHVFFFTKKNLRNVTADIIRPVAISSIRIVMKPRRAILIGKRKDIIFKKRKYSRKKGNLRSELVSHQHRHNIATEYFKDD